MCSTPIHKASRYHQNIVTEHLHSENASERPAMESELDASSTRSQHLASLFRAVTCCHPSVDVKRAVLSLISAQIRSLQRLSSSLGVRDKQRRPLRFGGRDPLSNCFRLFSPNAYTPLLMNSLISSPPSLVRTSAYLILLSLHVVLFVFAGIWYGAVSRFSFSSPLLRRELFPSSALQRADD